MPVFPRETLEKNLNSIYTEDTVAETVNVKNVGLRGVTVADTKVSFIDGEKGVLIYRGYRIEELAQSASFMEVAYLLLNGSLPLKKELTAFMTQVTAAREIPRHIYECFKKWPKDSNPMDVLQATVPMLAMVDPDLQDETRAANFRMATRLIGRLPVVVAGWHRIRNGLEPLSPDDSRIPRRHRIATRSPSLREPLCRSRSLSA